MRIDTSKADATADAEKTGAFSTATDDFAPVSPTRGQTFDSRADAGASIQA
jgi:hypothetical protein